MYVYVQERAGTCALQRVWISSEGQDHTGPPRKLRERSRTERKRGERETNREETVKRVRDLEGEREEVREKRGEMRERDCTLSSWQPMVVWLAVLVRGERAHTKYCARPMREK